jgi:gliding motility-associated-like protein
MPFCLRSILLFFLILAPLLRAEASHIRGGNITITIVSTSPTVVLFTVSLFRDSNSPVRIGNGQFDFWDGTVVTLDAQSDSSKVKDLGNNIEEHVYYISHRYGNDINFIIPSYSELNRNGGTVNLENSASVAFFMESEGILIADGRANNSPVFQTSPNDEGVVGELFVHNVGAFDPDGDSLSYELITPFSQNEIEVRDYYIPDSSWIDQFGNLNWDKPLFIGQYTFALRVNEWRFIDGSWKEIGFVIRDMQVFIRDLPNAPPTINPNGNLCVIAGDPAVIDMQVSDPTDRVSIEIFVEPSIDKNAFFTQPEWSIPFETPQNVQFIWNTSTDDVRKQAYPFYFKATDDFPDSQLSSFAVWNIRVLGAPSVFEADLKNSKEVELTINMGEGAEKREIWRSIGSVFLDTTLCKEGDLRQSGYEKIAELPATTSTYIDTNGTIGLSRGANYCYRVIAVFPDGSKSVLSEEQCVLIPVEAPVITKVSVLSTDSIDGQVSLQWTSSFDLPDSIDQRGYTYEVKYATIAQPEPWISLAQISDTMMTVMALNTVSDQFLFQVNLLDESIPIDSSSQATSVFLTSSSDQSVINLNWEFQTPWNNASPAYPQHLIYRNRIDQDDPTAFQLLDSVSISENFSYSDSGKGEPLFGYYSYYVETLGTYGNEALPSPLINRSQTLTQLAIDLEPPCQPVLTIINGSESDCLAMVGELGCKNAVYHNDLQLMQGCETDNDFKSFQVYYQAPGENSFSQITETAEPVFVHDSLSLLAGCYYTTAIDYSGNVSEPSSIMCRENCLNALLPNVFTPNNDGTNDTFGLVEQYNGNQASCPAFIQKIELVIVNRWGKQLYARSFTNPDLYSNLWDGLDNQKRKVASGTYFYHLTISYYSTEVATEDIEGWVDVMH